MSDFQIALFALGGAMVVVVWLYNRWLDRKHRRRAEQMLPRTGGDVLAPELAERFEKTESKLTAPRESTEVGQSLDGMEEGGSNVPVPAEWGDGQADCMLRVKFAAPVPVLALWEEHRNWSERIDKPIQWFGLEEQSGHWHTLLPQDSGNLTQLAVALQLVDRRGAVSDDTLKTFVDGIARLAQRFVGSTDVPPLTPLRERARELDAFCASVDLQLGLHVLPKGSARMSGRLLKSLIEAAGLRPEGGRYVALDASGAEAFALLCRSVTTFSVERLEAMELIDLIYSIDVPRVAAGAASFDRMMDFARQCADRLGGQLVDVHHKPLPEAMIATLRSRIDELQKRMIDHGIAPGSVRALRLFS